MKMNRGTGTVFTSQTILLGERGTRPPVHSPPVHLKES